MKTGTITKRCKNHQRETEHGIYEYNGVVNHRCLECAREQRAQRRKDPEKYEHDKRYTRMWSKINREDLRKKAKERERKKREEKIARVEKFLHENEKKILEYLWKIQSDYSYDKIENWCIRRGITSLDDVIDHIKRRKFSKLKDQEAWRLSSLMKYHFGVRENYEEIPEEMKKTIRAKYKIEALKEAQKKMEQIENGIFLY